MKQLFRHIVFFCFAGSIAFGQSIIPNLGGQRVGISSLQFLKIGIGGQGAGMQEAVVAVANDVSALYWNPAGAVLDKDNGVMFSHSEYLIELKHDFFGAIYHISSSDVVGLSCISLRTDDMPVTTETQPTGTGAYFRYSDFALGLTYARKMTTHFSFGTTVRYVEENLDVIKIQTVLFDFGTMYETGLGSLRIGVAVSNFGSDVTPKGNVTYIDGSTNSAFQSFSPPTVFKLGVAFEPYQTEQNRITTSIQLEHPNDNSELLRLGLEYGWSDWLRLRAGLKRMIGEALLAKSEKAADDLALGFGVIVPLPFTTVSFDYSYTNYNELGDVHRISCALTY